SGTSSAVIVHLCDSLPRRDAGRRRGPVRRTIIHPVARSPNRARSRPTGLSTIQRRRRRLTNGDRVSSVSAPTDGGAGARIRRRRAPFFHWPYAHDVRRIDSRPETGVVARAVPSPGVSRGDEAANGAAGELGAVRSGADAAAGPSPFLQALHRLGVNPWDSCRARTASE